MRTVTGLLTLLLFVLTLWYVSCAEVAPPPAAAPPPLQKAQNAVITYDLDGQKQTLTLDRAAAVKLADLLKPTRRDDIAPGGGGVRVQFTLADGKKVLLLMIEADVVWVEDWGLLELKDKGFHDHLKQVVEKHAGRKVDLVGQ